MDDRRVEHRAAHPDGSAEEENRLLAGTWASEGTVPQIHRSSCVILHVVKYGRDVLVNKSTWRIVHLRLNTSGNSHHKHWTQEKNYDFIVKFEFSIWLLTLKKK